MSGGTGPRPTPSHLHCSPLEGFSLVTSVAHTGESAVVRAHGEIDLATAPQLLDGLHQAVRPGRLIRVDLAGVTFMDCAGLRAILQAREEARQEGGHLVVYAPSAVVTRLLTLTGLHSLLTATGG